MKPKLVLHICCAPDEAWVVQSLHDSRELHCFFCNPNIQPEDEYVHRLEEARSVAQRFGVPFDAPGYDPGAWEEAIGPHENTPEGGQRCLHCFLLRLRATAAFCRQLQWPSFTTVMSISPHKNLDVLDRAGATAAAQYGVIFERHNFKKKDGFLNSIKLSKELGLYRQDYCGCRLSKMESAARRMPST